MRLTCSFPRHLASRRTSVSAYCPIIFVVHFIFLILLLVFVLLIFLIFARSLRAPRETFSEHTLAVISFVGLATSHGIMVALVSA